MSRGWGVTVLLAVVVVACLALGMGHGQAEEVVVPHQCDLGGDGYPEQVATVTRHVVFGGVYVAPYEVESCGATRGELDRWLSGFMESYELSKEVGYYPRGMRVEIPSGKVGPVGVRIGDTVLYPSWGEDNPPEVSR